MVRLHTNDNVPITPRKTHKTYRMDKIDPLDPRIVGTLLSPPWLLAGTEVLFFPFQQGDLVIFADFHVSQGK